MKIGLFFGSDTGVTESVAEKIVEKWTLCDIDLIDVADATPELFDEYSVIFIGASTWYYGELQSDWETFFEEFKTIDFTGKTVALFGCGDQYGYDFYFIDSVGILAKVVLENGGEIIGHYPTQGFEHEESKAQLNDDYFYGLPIDDDNQSELTDGRIDQWIQILEKEWQEKGLS